MLAQKRNKIMYQNMFSNFFKFPIGHLTHPPTSKVFLDFLFIYMTPKACWGDRGKLSHPHAAFQSEDAGKVLPSIDDLRYPCLIDVRGMQLFSTTQIFWGERSNQTCHNLLGGIRIFSVKICINPYPSSMHRCIATFFTRFVSRCSLQKIATLRRRV